MSKLNSSPGIFPDSKDWSSREVEAHILKVITFILHNPILVANGGVEDWKLDDLQQN